MKSAPAKIGSIKSKKAMRAACAVVVCLSSNLAGRDSSGVYPGEIAVRDLTDAQLTFVQEAFSDLVREIDFKGAERLSELTGNRLPALKILMSYFRRMRNLATITRQDLIHL